MDQSSRERKKETSLFCLLLNVLFIIIWLFDYICWLWWCPNKITQFIDKLKSELLIAMKQQLEDGLRTIKQHSDEMKELKQQLSEFRQLLQEKNA